MSPPAPELFPLLTALVQGSSTSPEERKSATESLKLWSTTPNFFSSLVEVFSNQELELGDWQQRSLIRLQAVVQFRIGVDKYWRKGSVNGISPNEKKAIRPKLLQLVNEPDRVLAKNVAACIAKIARLDYGTEWEELPTTLLTSLQLGLSSSSPQSRIIVHRSLLFLHDTIKSLSSNRVMKGKMIMNAFSGKLFPGLKELNTTFLSSFGANPVAGSVGGSGTAGGDEVLDIELALLSFKILSKLVLYGFKDASADADAKAFFQSSKDHFQALMSLRLNLLQQYQASSSSPQSTQSLTYLTKHLISFGKLYRNLLKNDSASFVRMGVTDPIISIYWQVLQAASVDVENLISDSPFSPYPEKLIVQSLLLLSSTMGDWASKSPIEVPPEFVKEFSLTIVAKFLPLRKGDLERWDMDPEEWMNEEESERWEFELRPCAEHVLKSLLSHYSTELGPSMASLLQQVSTPQSMEDLLLKEGVYCAFGRSPSDLQSSIDFDGWLEHTLVTEAGGTDSNYRIIRRRIAWLVGNWVSEDLSLETRQRIYSLLIHLLGQNPSTDTAIRLTAARSLAKCDTWDFDKNSFLPFLPSAVEETVRLLGEVELAESRMRLNQTLGVVIDRVGLHILPYASRLAEVLVNMWAGGQDESHFQTSVLVTLTKLAESLGEHSQDLHVQSCPIIQFSNDPSQPSHIYLQEDSLQLWQVLLRRSSTLSQEMIGLLPLLVSLLQGGTDVLPRALKILKSYLLLDATKVLQLCSTDLFMAFENLLGNLKLEAVKVILHALDTVFETAPIGLWAAALDQADALPKLLAPLQNNEPALIVTKYLCTISRIVVAGPDTFLQLLQATALRSKIHGDTLLEVIVTQWLDKVDNMAQGSQRKLTALALAYLLPTTNPIILSRLGQLFSLWASVMAETQEHDEDAEVYQEVFHEGDYDFEETLEAGRRSALITRDPVHAIGMAEFLRHKLAEAEALNGGAQAFKMHHLSTVDSGILEEVDKLMKGEVVS